MNSGRSSTPAITAAAPPRKSTPGSPWTNQETSNLIDSYEQIWFSLKRGHLKAQQWEQVASIVADRCGLSIPSKTGTQCRHKIEKLRKRYRSDRLRTVRSSWPFFERIDRMERGSINEDSRVLIKSGKRKRLGMEEEMRRFVEGYVGMEKKRMDVMREMEREWMEMEAKRMEMIMEAQKGIMEMIVGVFSKKAKNNR